jgi:mono/diheme cytochrome c family protein
MATLLWACYIRHVPQIGLLTGPAFVAFVFLAEVVFFAQTPARTVWDGVYTNAEAARGQTAFARSCGGCHRDDASGGDDSEPALRGPSFLHRWDESSAAALYDFIASNMPRNKPGSMTLPDCLDIVAYLLKLNDMPAGREELPADVEQLNRIRFTEKRRAP